MMQPLRMFVDENDAVLGAVSPKEIEEKELTVRIAGILIIRPNKNIVLHKVAPSKKGNPLKWNVSAAGHVDENETYETAALRELQEELGVSLTKADIKKLGYYVKRRTSGKTAWFATIFQAAYDGDFIPDAAEICEIKEFTPEELKKNLEENKDSFTWLTYDALQTYFQK